jgi:hypothetical protein
MKRPTNAGARRAVSDAVRHMLRGGDSPYRIVQEGYASPTQVLKLRTTVRVLPTDRRPS